jgi:hypothetical protein
MCDAITASRSYRGNELCFDWAVEEGSEFIADSIRVNKKPLKVANTVCEPGKIQSLKPRRPAKLMAIAIAGASACEGPENTKARGRQFLPRAFAIILVAAGLACQRERAHSPSIRPKFPLTMEKKCAFIWGIVQRAEVLLTTRTVYRVSPSSWRACFCSGVGRVTISKGASDLSMGWIRFLTMVARSRSRS